MRCVIHPLPMLARAGIVVMLVVTAACDGGGARSGAPSGQGDIHRQPPNAPGPTPRDEPARLWWIQMAPAAGPVTIHAGDRSFVVPYGEARATGPVGQGEAVTIRAGEAAQLSVSPEPGDLLLLHDTPDGLRVARVALPPMQAGSARVVLADALSDQTVTLCVDGTPRTVAPASVRGVEASERILLAPGRPFHVSVHAAGTEGGCAGSALARGTMNPSEGIVVLVAAPAPTDGEVLLHACARTVATPALSCRVLP